MEKKIVAGWRILLKISTNSHSKPSFMNDLEALKIRQIVKENVKLGISSLHAWIKGFESLPHLSYRLDIKQLSMRKADRLLVDARKSLQGKFRHQSRLLVDALGFGTTNDDNAVREFFWSTSNSLISYRD
ncbi:hypothetical protein TNIN_328881 [Trichonephila inaurata madagascariensis]|uniref:Uncharacterized protein n=1 Tax=Trichonephila inaurata madagascariensis TaxID=2747483 RepID=A0A8X6YX96_9ARAC|nr:hypothetical protein TNIN_328881 [Trichonephila inaurata madagascariensis]